MTAIDRSMPPPSWQREIAKLAADVQSAMAKAGIAAEYVIGERLVTITALHRYSAECSTINVIGQEVTFLVPLPKENWP